ncbi:MAG: PepSY1/2 domain-containing protein [Lysinibacillus sp.]
MRKWVYLGVLITLIVVLAVVDLYGRNKQLERHLQNQYAQQLAVASEEMTQLHTALFQSTIIKDERALNEQLLQVYEASSNAKHALASVPILQESASDWIHYFGDLQSLAGQTLGEGNYQDWHKKSSQLANDFATVEEEWAVLTANYFNHASTLNDYQVNQPNVSKLSTNLKSYSEQSFPVTASESDYEKKKKLEHVSEAPITKKQAEQRLFEMFPELKGATLTVSLNKEDAPYEFYHIQFVRGSRIGYVDLLKNGGQLLSMLIDRPVLEQQISQQQAQKHAEKFLKKHGFNDVHFVEARENHEVWHFVFARMVDGVLIYPDAIQLKVTKDQQEVTGVSALEYIQKETVDFEESKPFEWSTFLNENARVEQSRRVVIEGKQYASVLCYEGLVTTKEDGRHTYRIYVNAKNHTIEKMELIN